MKPLLISQISTTPPRTTITTTWQHESRQWVVPTPTPCSETQGEQGYTRPVPHAKVEPEHDRNNANPSATRLFSNCSGVPLENPEDHECICRRTELSLPRANLAIHRPPVFPFPTGTTATGMRHKGLRPVASGTCSGTQVEQFSGDHFAPERGLPQTFEGRRP